MKKIVIAVMSTVSGLVLLFSYHTSTNSDAATTPATDESGNGTGPSASAPTTPNAGEASGATPSAGGSSAASGSSASGTYTGDAVATRWGPVQVRITVKDGKITSADAIEHPSGNHEDQKRNAYAIPQLNAEAVAAQSAKIDAVSGATVTSDGYLTSLQSAIDQAHLR